MRSRFSPRNAIKLYFQETPSVSMFLLKQPYRLLLKQTRVLHNKMLNNKMLRHKLSYFLRENWGKSKCLTILFIGIHSATLKFGQYSVFKFLWKMSCVWQASWNMRLIKMFRAFSRPYATNCVGLEKYCLNVHLNTVNKQFSLSIWINEILLISKHNLN